MHRVVKSIYCIPENKKKNKKKRSVIVGRILRPHRTRKQRPALASEGGDGYLGQTLPFLRGLINHEEFTLDSDTVRYTFDL